ncbi:hypothetical protein ACFSJ3_15355 [Corallincola platygyrae]|uniref:Uncharacterized protein n=1 Tax=Corallincola platygyrae TaxID=1193278 RepID=A0ABW4XQE0_9GAMM
MKVKLSKPRNLHACSPLMRKGGAHGRSQKAQRQADKQATQLDAWEEYLMMEREETGGSEPPARFYH